MRTKSIAQGLAVASAVSFVLAYSVMNLGWPPVGFEASGLVWLLGNVLGGICLVASLVSFALYSLRHSRSNRIG